MDERFEQQMEAELEALREKVRFLEYQVMQSRTPSERSASPARNIAWDGQDGTLGAILPKIGDLRK